MNIEILQQEDYIPDRLGKRYSFQIRVNEKEYPTVWQKSIFITDYEQLSDIPEMIEIKKEENAVEVFRKFYQDILKK